MPAETSVRIFPDLPALSLAAAEEFVSRARAAIQARGIFTVVLSGGSTPRTLYRLLAENPGFKDAVEWDKAHFFFSDERHVPPDHPENNYRMAYRALLSKIPAPPRNTHRMATEVAEPEPVAELCEQALRQFFRLKEGEAPRFDLVLLGMGADGHVASLFPGSPALAETRKLAVAVWIDTLEAWRITLTLPVLNNAEEVLFLVSGASKSQALRKVLEGAGEAEPLPARAVRPVRGRLLFFADQEAAKLLTSASGHRT
ncbi:MAG TPA: 6-phosphogluconolactonase [Candidatus Polarisedimenticolia bacterium]|nr:6-phosphogluconolactonase [Candidatus Polarisedimenticolia bacterium]